MTGAAAPLVLEGDAYRRGRAQAALCPDSIAAVRATCAARLAAAAPLLARPRVARHLARQWEFTERRDPEVIAELTGIADGYGLPPADLFAFLHAGQLSGLPDDGCTAWGFVHPEYGALLVKNRDLRGPALALQRVFLHRDPAWRGRAVLCVGSLGAPGAYSSGINSDGFALVDTQVVTRDQGVGLLRYFLMTRLLRACASVEAALALLRDMPHAGGGTLVLADAAGALAAVEIGHAGLAVESRATGWAARTNHFLAPSLAAALLAEPSGPDLSIARLARVTRWLAGRAAPPDVAEAARFMAGHDDASGPGPCRHGGGTGSATVSCAIYRCRPGGLDFAHGNPCEAAWTGYAPPA
jgi:hypothetical protein